MGWSYKITKAKNGFIIENNSDDNYEDKGTQVIEEDKQDEHGELKSMENMLYELKELFGCFYSKHNKKNIIIKIEDINE